MVDNISSVQMQRDISVTQMRLEEGLVCQRKMPKSQSPHVCSLVCGSDGRPHIWESQMKKLPIAVIHLLSSFNI